jgi:amino acid adenylation domain-containing protein
MVIAVLGILKAGAAYVPLDPAYPSDRLTFTLQDAAALVVLTQENLTPLVAGTSARVICIDREREIIAREALTNPVTGVTPRNLAYVIYTSGSTGQPKGVAIEHTSTVTFLRWAIATFNPQELSGVLQSTSICFDLSVFELFAPLSVGGKVIVVDNALALTSMDSGEVTLINTVPSAMTELVNQQAIPASVTTVNLAGEPLRNSLVQAVYQQENIGRVLNLYGPSEDTTYSTFVSLAKGATEEPTIGRPIANTTVYLLDANLQPAPVGVPGELFLGGAGLARGYLNRSEQTAERFIPDPFGGVTGSRLYRTGDLARYRADGSLEFLGRIDHQVKIRGFRIELGEIEALLRTHPAVRDAAVQPNERHDGLVAYVVVEQSRPGDREPVSTELKKHLASKLPDYMLPSIFVELEALPLTPNGKVDRRALKVPTDHRPAGQQQVAPRNEAEAMLLQLWQKVLGLKTIGVTDNFFELGGHSLLASRLFAQIQNTFGKHLPLSALFQSPTIEQLALALREPDAQQSWSSLVAIQPKGSRPPLFCVHAAGANVLIYRPLARHLGFDQPVYALQAQGLDGKSEPLVRVEQMAALYIKEIRALQPQGPYYLLGASFGGLVIYEMAQQLEAAGQEVALLVMLNTDCPVYTVTKRLRCHLGNLQTKGPKIYFTALIRSVLRSLNSRMAEKVDEALAGNAELQAAIESRPDLNDPLVRAIVANLQAEQDYRPAQRQYRGKIIYFRARDAESDFADNRDAWQRLAAGEFELHVVPGDHSTMREEPNIGVLVEKLRPALK